MTDNQEQTSDNQIENDEPQSQETLNQLQTDDLDVEGALAAIASLQDLTREEEPEIEAVEEEIEAEPDEESPEIREFERIEDGDLALVVEESLDQETETSVEYEARFPHPPSSTLHRGQMASVVPAMLLISIGAYLTFIVTTTDFVLQPTLVIAVLIAILGAMLLAQWISSARWAIGSFFIGVLLLFTGGTATYLVLPNNISLVDGYPLLLTAIGTAFVMTDVFVPSGRRIWLIGLILAIAGLAGVVVTTSLLDISFLSSLDGLLPLAIVIIIILLIAPILRRRQQ